MKKHKLAPFWVKVELLELGQWSIKLYCLLRFKLKISRKFNTKFNRPDRDEKRLSVIDDIGVVLFLSPLYTVVGISFRSLAFNLITLHSSFKSIICCSSANKRSFVSPFFMKRIPQTNTKRTDRKDGLMKGRKYPIPWYLEGSNSLAMFSTHQFNRKRKEMKIDVSPTLKSGYLCELHWHSISP